MAKGKKYTEEFKNSAIQLALTSGDSIRKIAKDLGIHDKTLYGWLKKYREKHNFKIKHYKPFYTSSYIFILKNDFL